MASKLFRFMKQLITAVKNFRLGLRSPRIGVYDLQTGNPLIRVVNQPFIENIDDKWRGMCYWGTLSVNSLGNIQQSSNKVICISSSENAGIINKFEKAGCALVAAAGAGYTILTTITGSAEAYILSKDSTFKWATCGPQAILKSLGGDIVIYNAAVEDRIVGINYAASEGSTKIEGSCNRGGIIAYRDGNALARLLDVLR